MVIGKTSHEACTMMQTKMKELPDATGYYLPTKLEAHFMTSSNHFHTEKKA